MSGKETKPEWEIVQTISPAPAAAAFFGVSVVSDLPLVASGRIHRIDHSINPMKTIVSILIAAACASQAIAQNANPAPARTADTYYRQGLAAEKAGDPEAARTAYAEALRLQPGHADARYRLGELKVRGPAIAAKGREAKFGAVLVPEFRVDDATLKECLDALELIVTKQSKEAVSPNFIIQDPKDQLSAAKVSLNLKNVPASGVMRYLLEMTGSKARYDEHAIVIAPK
jgi:tetratricopeptide (TPR) repeat protein